MDRIRPRVLTLGVFDGVHLGHQAVLAETFRWAAERTEEPLALVFHPHPASILRGEQVPTLCTPERRAGRLRSLGVPAESMPFDAALAGLEAETFLERLRGMGMKAMVLGHDSRFGKGRRGDAALVASLGIPVREVPPVLLGGRAVSSRRVREALRAGDLPEARACLGRSWILEGTVVRGDGRGRSLGFPTANLDVGESVLPARGVYAGRVLLDGKSHAAALNVGVRPSVGDGGEERAEAHLAGWEGDLYGKRLEVEMLERIRDERAFGSTEALAAQIGRDVAGARVIAGS